MITLPAALEYIRDARIHRFSICLKIVRRDGVTFRFTDHNTKLTVLSEVYTPVGSVKASAVRKSDSFRGQDIEYLGVIDSAAITTENLREGRYRGTIVYEYQVDWKYPWLGPFRTNKYFLTECRFNGEFWEGSLGGLTTLLEQFFGEYFTRNCRHELGDAGCKVDLNALKASNVTVQSVANTRNAFTAADGVFAGKAADYWQFGVLEWTIGINTGLFSEAFSSTVASGNNIDFVLFVDTPLDISVGDKFHITPGCDHTAVTCKGKFSNLVNYGGFHFIPGLDSASETPE